MKINQYIKHQTSNVKHQRGVTLVELSIALIVVALVVTGILGGQQLVKNAEINNMVRDKKVIESATSAFQEKYKSLPGDFSDAFATWGTNCAASSANCDGDSNNRLDKVESVKAWKHLDLSGFMTIGINRISSANESCTLQTYMPEFSVTGGTAFFDYISTFPTQVASATTLGFRNPYITAATNSNAPNQVFVFATAGSSAINTTGCGDTGFLTAEQAYLFDKKTDDGLASTGNVLGSNLGETNCLIATGSDIGDWDVVAGKETFCRIYNNLKVY